MVVDGYIRVSQVRGRSGDSFISPSLQRDRIKNWAKLHGHEIGMMHEELDESGARSDRPKLQLALKRVERGETGGIVVAKLDRFGRSLTDSLAAIERIQAAGGTFASVADGFDLGTDTGRLVLRIMLSLAEFELDRIRGVFADARARAVARGVHPSPVPPVGYTRNNETSVLEPDQNTGPIITQVFHRRANAEAFVDIAKFLEASNVKSAYGSSTWTGRAVREVIKNRVYTGEARHGEFINPSAHEPLVDEITWRRAQQASGVSPMVGPGKGSLLSGILRCGGCRYGMSAAYPKGRVEYKCHRVYPGGRCPNPTMISGENAKFLEEIVTERLFEAVGEHLRMTPVIENESLVALEKEIASAQAALEIFRDDPRIIDTLGPDAFAEGLAKRKAALDQAQQALATATPSSPLPGGIEPADLRTIWPLLENKEQRALLSAVFDCIFLNSNRPKGLRKRQVDLADYVYFCFKGEAPPDMPSRDRLWGAAENRSIPPTPFDFPDR